MTTRLPQFANILPRTIRTSLDRKMQQAFLYSVPFAHHHRSRSSLSLHHFSPKTKNRKVIRANVAGPETPVPSNIAIVGGGLAGLATAYHLLNSTERYSRKRSFSHTDMRITIFDPSKPGCGGATATATGLLHPFRPRVKQKVWRSVKSIDAALHLLQQAETIAGESLVVHSGMLRLALNETQISDYQIAANRFPDELEYLHPQQIAERYPHVNHTVPGLFLKKAAVVNTKAYVRALWRLCEQSGRVEWRLEAVQDVRNLFHQQPSPFDTVVICAGASIPSIAGFSNVPLMLSRGQNLLLQPHKESYAHKVPVLCGKYIVPDLFTNTQCPTLVVGATFEHQRDEKDTEMFMRELSKVDTNKALDELNEPLNNLAPMLYESCKVIGATSGTRASPPRSSMGTVPIVCQLSGTVHGTSCWIFTGLGSRGLLHHAYLGRMLAHGIAAGNDRLIPMDARRVEIALQSHEPNENVAIL